MFLLEVIRLSIHAKTVSAVHMKKRVSVLCSQLRSSAYQTKKNKRVSLRMLSGTTVFAV